MAKRRTAQLQRRPRASEEALSRRVGGGRRVEWRILLLAAAIPAAIIVVVVAVGLGSQPNQYRGQIQPDAGASHIQTGQVGTYTSTPATSGGHWAAEGLAPANWGVYTSANPLPEQAALHNMEHAGIVIWYQADKLSQTDIAALESFVRTQNASERYKFIVSPWSGKDFGHPIAIVAWRWLLYLDTATLDALRAFSDEHYGKGPEPAGGPARPAG